MKVRNLEVPGIVGLAPMAGVTDPAFRAICAEHGAALTVTEMVSSRALCYQDKKSVTLLPRTPTGICGAQIFGNDPATMARAAQLALEHSKADYIDINMGCPMPKIVGNGDGCALMRNIPLAKEIVQAVKEAIDVPVTVKCRKGWDKGNANAPEFAAAMELAGADAICVHGRTKVQLYTGTADWDIIRDVKNAVRIPVIANGDIFNGEKAIACLKRTGADFLLVGRSSFGNPWVFEEINAAIAGIPYQRPPLAERIDTAMEQFRLAMDDKGERIACLEARKHLAWYLRGIPYSGYYKDKISQVSDFHSLEAAAEGIKRDLRDPAPGDRNYQNQ